MRCQYKRIGIFCPPNFCLSFSLRFPQSSCVLTHLLSSLFLVLYFSIRLSSPPFPLQESSSAFLYIFFSFTRSDYVFLWLFYPPAMSLFNNTLSLSNPSLISYFYPLSRYFSSLSISPTIQPSIPLFLSYPLVSIISSFSLSPPPISSIYHLRLLPSLLPFYLSLPYCLSFTHYPIPLKPPIHLPLSYPFSFSLSLLPIFYPFPL